MWDRGYLDYCSAAPHHAGGTFLSLAPKANLDACRIYPDRRTSKPASSPISLIALNGYLSSRIIQPPGRISFVTRTPAEPCLPYQQSPCPLHHLSTLQSRWQVNCSFKRIKQHLRIKAFYGTSEKRRSKQLWIAISVYLLVAIVKKRLALPLTQHFLQVLSVTMFEKMPISRALSSRKIHITVITPTN